MKSVDMDDVYDYENDDTREVIIFDVNILIRKIRAFFFLNKMVEYYRYCATMSKV